MSAQTIILSHRRGGDHTEHEYWTVLSGGK